METTEKRWALAAKFDGEWRLLGKYCWPNTAECLQRILTFRTRHSARCAKKRMCSYRSASRIVRVEVIVRQTQGG